VTPPRSCEPATYVTARASAVQLTKRIYAVDGPDGANKAGGPTRQMVHRPHLLARIYPLARREKTLSAQRCLASFFCLRSNSQGWEQRSFRSSIYPVSRG